MFKFEYYLEDNIFLKINLDTFIVLYNLKNKLWYFIVLYNLKNMPFKGGKILRI